MLFNSFVFALFLPLTFACYWLLQRYSLKIQNTFVLLASYVFYGWWDWRFLALIVVSSLVDYLASLRLDSTRRIRSRKIILGISVAVNLGLLGFFKYYDFFVDSFAGAIQLLGFDAHIHALRVILPVGISFYTFQKMSYTIDVYRRLVVPTRDVIAFFAYISFFPQLVAGPIERANHLLPQFLKKRSFQTEHAKDGIRQILWGLFKKVVIADSLAPIVEQIYSNYGEYSGLTLFLGTLYFAFQIYCDFSGYSDIAVGTARLFGFNLMQNFACPYFSRNIGEFWRRWHISLSTWFRDYVYIPLGGSRTLSKGRHIANLLVTFTASGFWHGANWTFVAWGFLNGVYYIPLILGGRNRPSTAVVAENHFFPSLRETAQMTFTFALTLFAWIFFRAESIAHAFSFIGHMASSSWLTADFTKGLKYAAALLVIEWLQRNKLHALQLDNVPLVFRWAAYYTVVIAILMFSNTGQVTFIYFQF